MVRKYTLSGDPEFNSYYKSENIQNTNFNKYKNISSNLPNSFIGLTGDVFLNPQEIIFEPKKVDDLREYNKLEERNN